MIEPGRILIAPGDFHMKSSLRWRQGVRVPWINAAAEFLPSRCRCAFASAGEVYGGAAVAVILTGMGQDGCAALKFSRRKGPVFWRRMRHPVLSGVCPAPS